MRFDYLLIILVFSIIFISGCERNYTPEEPSTFCEDESDCVHSCTGCWNKDNTPEVDLELDCGAPMPDPCACIDNECYPKVLLE
jgi:hypothetical protein